MKETEMRSPSRPLTREAIKYLAVLAMALNHTAHVFLTPGTVLYEVFVDIGYFTAITMCYFLAEGFRYTRSKRQYGARLLAFALMSQIPFQLAFGTWQLNMLFSLFFCFLLLAAQEQIADPTKRALATAALLAASALCDWAVMAAAFTLLFSRSLNSRRETGRVFLLCTLAFMASSVLDCLSEMALPAALLHGILSGTGLAASGFCILFLYNGRQARWGRRFSKWFFYCFYPAHLAVLVGIRFLLTGRLTP